MTDKDERRRLKRTWKQQQKARAREQMILESAELDDLLDVLDRGLSNQPCDHSLSQTKLWALSAGVNATLLVSSLEYFGGFCDCEVLANVDPEAIY